ncbi:MAG: LPS assembly lipoprotein LptE [Pseudomonadota bacterium]
MMKSLSAAVFVSLASAMASGCGFQPVYSPSASSSASPLQIDQIDGRAGHELRRALLQETANGLPGAAQGGRLTVQLSEQLIRTGFESDGTTRRALLRMKADYVIDTGDNALSGSETAEISTNVPSEIFQDITNQNEARRSAAHELARKITNRLIVDLTETP